MEMITRVCHGVAFEAAVCARTFLSQNPGRFLEANFSAKSQQPLILAESCPLAVRAAAQQIRRGSASHSPGLKGLNYDFNTRAEIATPEFSGFGDR